MRDLIPDVDDFLDAIWNCDDLCYNGNKKATEVQTTGEEFPGEDCEN